MDFRVEIEYWEDVDGISPIVQFIRERPLEHQVRIKKRNDHFRNLTFQQLRNTPFFELATGAKHPLWELKYLASKGMNYRALCIIHKNILVVLVVFKGSGSGGRLQKYFPQAIQRAEEWKQRHP